MPALKKKILSFAIATFLVLLIYAGAAYAEGTGIIKGDAVNMRTSADTSSQIIMQLSKNSEVQIITKDGDWFNVNFEGKTGWVYGEYVSEQIVQDEGTITGNNVNIRSGAGTEYEVVGQFDKNARVTVYGYSGNWVKIKLEDGTFGWVCSDYVKVSAAKASRGLEGERPSAGDSSAVDKNNLRSEIVAYAKKYLGVKYVYGGSSPKGFDCSGFVQYVLKNFDIKLARTSVGMAAGGEKISKAELKPGDLVFFDTNGGLNKINHVGIYIGDGKFIHSSSSKSTKCVTISTLTDGFYKKTYMTARRYVD